MQQLYSAEKSMKIFMWPGYTDDFYKEETTYSNIYVMECHKKFCDMLLEKKIIRPDELKEDFLYIGTNKKLTKTFPGIVHCIENHIYKSVDDIIQDYMANSKTYGITVTPEPIFQIPKAYRLTLKIEDKRLMHEVWNMGEMLSGASACSYSNEEILREFALSCEKPADEYIDSCKQAMQN